jgi:lipoprotein-anchoring transpeptidase ErfK/SrfK
MRGGRRALRRSDQWLTVLLLGVTLLGAAALAGCTSGSAGATGTKAGGTATVAAQPAASAPPSTPVATPATVAVRPAAGTRDANPGAQVAATVSGGTITTVKLTNAAGKVVTGRLSADKRTWSTTEQLGYGKTYTWSGSAVGTDAKSVPISGSFTTVTPARKISGSLNVSDNQTYGVAIPIALTFSSDVTDKAAVEKALKVTTSVPTTGSWAWLDDETVHWRPSVFFQPDTKVTVQANLYGVAFAPGVYGKSDVSARFAIGRSQIVQADTRSHRMVVFTSGKKTADFPASFGLDSDPGRVTHSGTHVVMSRSPTYFMTNEKYDYSHLEVHWAVRISNNGEFVHAAPWSVGQQGRVNVSHGCVNLSTANALAYYDSVLVGDPVEITGSTQKLGPSSGDYYDWTLTWAQWQAKSALTA